MSPLIIAGLALVIVALDLIIDLQLYGVSVALSLLIVAVLTSLGLEMDDWQLVSVFTLTTVSSIFLTRKFVKKMDNDDINKY